MTARPAVPLLAVALVTGWLSAGWFVADSKEAQLGTRI
jgi:hypothetical protein